METVVPKNNALVVSKKLPDYPMELRMKIVRARDAALTSNHNAWYSGTSSVDGARTYEVFSSTSKEIGSYFVQVRNRYTLGSFCYALEEGGPLWWITCQCKAASYDQPCRHGARVQLRLEREERR